MTTIQIYKEYQRNRRGRILPKKNNVGEQAEGVKTRAQTGKEVAGTGGRTTNIQASEEIADTGDKDIGYSSATALRVSPQL